MEYEQWEPPWWLKAIGYMVAFVVVQFVFFVMPVAVWLQFHGIDILGLL